jgi:hypothetical protein
LDGSDQVIAFSGNSRAFSLLSTPIATKRWDYQLSRDGVGWLELGAKHWFNNNEDYNRYHHKNWDFVKHAEIFVATHLTIRFQPIQKLPTHEMVDKKQNN